MRPLCRPAAAMSTYSSARIFRFARRSRAENSRVPSTVATAIPNHSGRARDSWGI